SVNDASGNCCQIARSSAVMVSQPYRNMYRPGSVTRPALCHVTLLTTDCPSLPLGAEFLKNHITTIRRPEPADRMRVVYPVTMDSAGGDSVAFGARSPSVTGNCSTVARWPSQSCVTSTWLPSGNSIASWWRSDTSGSIWLNLPTRQSVVRVQIHRLSYLTSSANASSVPGSMQTATAGSRSDAKPRVDVPRNVVVISVSPTWAGRVATACRL